MKLTRKNTGIIKKDNTYALVIYIPDGTGNYLHSQKYDLQEIKDLREKILDRDINYIHIEEDCGYYRLSWHASMKTYPNMVLHFHSRQLNLTDAIREHDMLVKPDSSQMVWFDGT